jgi:hypothetical protein
MGAEIKMVNLAAGMPGRKEPIACQNASLDAGIFEPMRAAPRSNSAQGMAVRRPWQRVAFARYTMAPGSGWNRSRDQFPVWALPGQCQLSDYLRIPSLPITSR